MPLSPKFSTFRGLSSPSTPSLPYQDKLVAAWDAKDVAIGDVTSVPAGWGTNVGLSLATVGKPRCVLATDGVSKGVYFDGTTELVSASALATFPSKRGALFTVFRPYPYTAYKHLVSTYNQAGTVFSQYITQSGTKYKWFDGSGLSEATDFNTPVATVEYLHRTANDTLKLWQGGVLKDTFSIADNQPSSNPVFVGGVDSGGSFKGYVSFVALFRDLTAGEAAEVDAYLRTRFADLAFDRQLVLGCDSISLNWPGMFAELEPTYCVTNFSVSGRTLATMEAEAASDVDLVLDPSMARPVLVAFAGTNDFYFGADAATVIGLLHTYCSSRKSAFPTIPILVATMLPRSNPGTPVDFEDNRQLFNADVRDPSHLGVRWDGVVDLAAIPGVGAAGDELNTANYLDRVHPTPALEVVLAAEFRTAALAL